MGSVEDVTRVALPWSKSCFVCGESNRRGMQARSYKVGDAVDLPFTVPEEFAGWVGVTHGGLVATVLDEVMTWAAILSSSRPCYAAEFTVRMRATLPPGTSCVARARTLRNRGRVLDVESELCGAVDRTVYAAASGRYMPVPRGQVGSNQHADFVLSPESLDVTDIFR